MTKYLIPAIVMLTLIFTSCAKKNNVLNDSGCIERQIPSVAETPLNSMQLDSIRTLFSLNTLSTSSLQFIQFSPNIYTDTARVPQTQVWANLFINGLPMFGNNEVFIFNAGIFDTAYLYTGRPTSNDTAAHQSLPSLRHAFFQHVAEAIIYSPFNIPNTIPSPAKYADSCLIATLGYLDVTAVPGNSANYGSLVKVWQISPLNGTPTVYVQDGNAVAWGQPVFIP